jgi:hypothetical protein
MWFMPGQTWDHTRIIYEVNRNLPDLFGITGTFGRIVIGVIAIGLFFAASAWGIHKLATRTALNRKVYARTNVLQYVIFQVFAITILVGLPAKMVLRLLFRVKYVLITPWFNI